MNHRGRRRAYIDLISIGSRKQSCERTYLDRYVEDIDKESKKVKAGNKYRLSLTFASYSRLSFIDAIYVDVLRGLELDVSQRKFFLKEERQ